MCITDQQYEENECGWEIDKVNPDVIRGDSHRSSRYYKILAHKLFPNHNRSIYVDASVKLTRDPEDIWKYLMPTKEHIFGGFYHSFRDTLLDEFHEVERKNLDYRFILAEQFNTYKQFCPHLINSRPVWGGFLARQHNNSKCMQSMETWFHHVLRFSRRDQLSLPFSLSLMQASRVNLLSQDIFKSDFHEYRWKVESKPSSYTMGDFELRLSKDIVLSEHMKTAMHKGYIESNGKKFIFSHPRMNDGIRRALIRGDYENPETNLIKKYINPKDTVVELGICIGYTSMNIYEIVREKLFLFEADPATAELAQKNMDLNQMKTTVHNYALLPNSLNILNKGKITFYSSSNSSSSSLYRRGRGDIEIEVNTLGFEAAIKILGATALVLDIEGGEVDLMIHCTDWSKITTIIMETHARVVGKDAIENAFEKMISHGFNLVQGGESQSGFAVFKKN